MGRLLRRALPFGLNVTGCAGAMTIVTPAQTLEALQTDALIPEPTPAAGGVVSLLHRTQ